MSTSGGGEWIAIRRVQKDLRKRMTRMKNVYHEIEKGGEG
jgi:hypothetical protein